MSPTACSGLATPSCFQVIASWPPSSLVLRSRGAWLPQKRTEQLSSHLLIGLSTPCIVSRSLVCFHLVPHAFACDHLRVSQCGGLSVPIWSLHFQSSLSGTAGALWNVAQLLLAFLLPVGHTRPHVVIPRSEPVAALAHRTCLVGPSTAPRVVVLRVHWLRWCEHAVSAADGRAQRDFIVGVFGAFGCKLSPRFTC